MTRPILVGAAVGLWAVWHGHMPGWAVAGWVLLFSGSDTDAEGLAVLAARLRQRVAVWRGTPAD